MTGKSFKNQHAIYPILLYSFPYVKMELQAVCISEEIQPAEHFRLQPLDMQHRGEMNISSMKPLDRGNIFTTAKATLVLLSYSTFWYCFYPYFKTWALFCNRHTQESVHIIILIKLIMEGKDKVTVWPTTNFSLSFVLLRFFTYPLTPWWLFSHMWYCAYLSLAWETGDGMVGNRYTVLGTE